MKLKITRPPSGPFEIEAALASDAKPRKIMLTRDQLSVLIDVLTMAIQANAFKFELEL
jgi:hypothetical protein